jgi:hypothetical protein
MEYLIITLHSPHVLSIVTYISLTFTYIYPESSLQNGQHFVQLNFSPKRKVNTASLLHKKGAKVKPLIFTTLPVFKDAHKSQVLPKALLTLRQNFALPTG